MADVRIKVVDDLGEAVPDATISVTFYTAPEKVDVKRGKTDDIRADEPMRHRRRGENHDAGGKLPSRPRRR